MDQEQNNNPSNEEREESFNWWSYYLAWAGFIASVIGAFVAAAKIDPPNKNGYYKK